MSSRPLYAAVLLAILTAGCHEELGIGTPSAARLEVEALELQGVNSVDESRLRSVLATKESPSLPWRQRRYFDREEFDQDLKRIVAFYGDHGFPNAEVVSHEVEVVDDGQGVRLRIAISEGDPLIISDIRLEDFDVLRPDVIDRLRRDLPLHPDDRLVVQQAIATGEAAANVLRNHGYPQAEVKLDREPRDAGVVLVLRAQPGPLAFFGRIDIAGNASVGDDVIRRQLVYRPGERFRQADVRQSVRELQALELFQYVNIELVERGTESDGQTVDPNVVPTRVTVAEGDHRRLELSLGYGTEEKLRAEAEWRHVNFYGGARTLGLHGKWSWVDRGVEGTFVQPYFGLPQLSLTMQGQAWYADEPAFDALSRGGRASLQYRLGRNASASGTLQYQFQSSRIANEALLDPSFRDELIALGLNPTTGEQDGTLVAVGANLQWMRTDAPVDPKRGYVVLLEMQQSGGWLPGTYNYISVIPEVRVYYTPIDRLTVAARARYGAIDPFGPVSDVPFFKRFFLGGATGLRGWGRYEVSPLSGSGLPIGGHSLFESSVELRAGVWGKLGLVAFVDAGNVWSEPWQGQFRDLLYDAGPGIRYDTPIGPLRLDFAYQLNRLEGLRIDGELQERPWRIHFSIGHTF